MLKQVTNVIDSAGKGMTNCYNNQGLLCIVSNAYGFQRMTKYDEEDHAMQVTDANTVTNQFTYDDLGRTTKRTDGNGKVELYGYSTLGMTVHSNELGQATRYTYDVAGRKTQEVNANGETNSFTYNAAGDLTKLIDGKGQETTWGYDQYARVTSKTNAAGQEVFRYAYDANGRLTNRWSLAKGNTRYVYDSAGNLTLVDYASSSDITMQYDANNRLTNMVDAAGTTRYAYTDFSALLSEDGPWDSDTVSYAFTTNLLRSKVTLLQPNASDWVQTYAYDNADRLTNVTSPAGAFGYLYDNAVHLEVRKLTQPPGSYITNTFDVLGRWTGTYQKNSGGTLLNAHEYLYDDASRRTRQTRLGPPASQPAWTNLVDYTYDSIGQLKTASGKEHGGTTNRMNEQLGYAYDAAGNLNYRTNDALVQTFNVNNQNEITTVTRSGKQTVSGTTWGPATNVTVADNGNSPVAALRYADHSFARTNVTLLDGTNTFTAVAQDTYGRSDTNTTLNYLPSTNTYAWDGNGNLITNGTRIFAYDDENQLTTITEPTGWKSEFTYDGKKRRRIRNEYVWSAATTNWQQSLEVRYVYAGNLVIQERHYHSQLSTQTPFNSISYTRGRDLRGTLEGAGGIGGLLARTDNSTLNSGDPSASPHAYYHADGNGNVTLLLATNQTVAARYLFDPFGRTLFAVGALAEANLYRFSCKEVHPSSGMAYFLYRYYAPANQRWLNRDPVNDPGSALLRGSRARLLGDSPNQSQFVSNDPVGHHDPAGLLFGTPGAGEQCADNTGTYLAACTTAPVNTWACAAAAVSQGICCCIAQVPFGSPWLSCMNNCLAEDFASGTQPCWATATTFAQRELCHNQARKACNAQCPSPSIWEMLTPCAGSAYLATLALIAIL